MLSEEQIAHNIEVWGANNLHPDLLRFERNGEVSARIWLEPWYGMEKWNPPLDTQTLILDQLLEIFHAWRKDFDRAKRAVDLQLILFETNFIQSEISAVKVTRSGSRYAFPFHPDTEIRRFPYERFFENREQLRDFEWKNYCVGEYLHPEIDGLNVLEIEQYLSEGFRKEWPKGRKDQGNYLLFRPTDRVWIGRWV